MAFAAAPRPARTGFRDRDMRHRVGAMARGAMLAEGAMRILIVEDEALLAMALAASLLEAGHMVIGSAATEAGAIALVDGTTPDLALVDIRLQDGDSGTAVARHLHRRGIPSLFVSGQIDEARANRDSALGCLGKPYSPVTVLASIEVAKAVIAGDAPAALPPGLELF